ncbi:hypothetical protein [Saccharopolyspora sp. NPDC050642]|uniref:hypothetical protein n=1 Tax=Saccharopolyspora sp. NPDC050642 TaxID=3157099 RepID=UPI0033C94F29
MTAQPQSSGAPQADLDAARLLLDRLGVSAEDLLATPSDRPPVPTFADYIPIVSAAVTDGTRWVYGSYWNRIENHWGHRRLDEPAPSKVKQLGGYSKTHVITRRNARGGRSAGEHLIAALRRLYRYAKNDRIITLPTTQPPKSPNPADFPLPDAPSLTPD